MLDKRYNIKLDIKTNKASYPVMTFAKVDEETSDFYIQVNREGISIDLTGCEITLNIQKPNGNIESKVVEYDSELELVYCNLEQNMKNIEGEYSADILIVDGKDQIATPRFHYEVVNDVSSDFIENVDEEELTTLQQLIEDVRSVNYIDDENISEATTYSSSKIEEIVQNVDIGEINVPTKTSDLENDSGFITGVPSEYITETELNAKGYLTEHQDISNLASKDYVNTAIEGVDVTDQLSDYALKTDLHSHSNKTVLDGITSDKIASWDNKSTFSGSYNDLTNKPTIPTVPTNISAFTNDRGYITSVPSEYVTDSELTSKNYATTSYVDSKVSSVEATIGVEIENQLDGAKTDIVADVISQLGGMPVLGTVDDNNIITVTSALAEGNYILKYEYEDGTTSEIGTITISGGSGDVGEGEEETLVNLVTTSLNIDGNGVYNTNGYKDGVYISTNGTDNPSKDSVNATTVATGLIPYTLHPQDGVLYVKGATIDTSASHCRCQLIGSDCNIVFQLAQGSSSWTTYFDIATLGTNYYKLTPTLSNGSIKYIRFSFVGSGENLVIATTEIN